jgi:hypothetical protein
MSGDKAYVATTASPDSASLYEFDLKSGKTLWLCTMAELDPILRNRPVHTGYDSWDPAGRFYFASFNWHTDQHVILTRVDPVRLKAH